MVLGVDPLVEIGGQEVLSGISAWGSMRGESSLSMGVQERRAQSKHGDQAILIRVVQRQHGGSFLRLARDLRITLFSNSTTDTKERRFYFQ
jgi:hypothetical protein